MISIYNLLFKLRILHHILLFKGIISYIDGTFGLWDKINKTLFSSNYI